MSIGRPHHLTSPWCVGTIGNTVWQQYSQEFVPTQHGSHAKGTRGTASSLLSRRRFTVPNEFQITTLEVTGQHRAFDSMHDLSIQSARTNSLHLQREFPNSSLEVNTARILDRATIRAQWPPAAMDTATRAEEPA